MSNYLRVGFVLLFVVCTGVVVALWQGMDSLLFAWVINLMLMMGVAYITQTFNLQLTSTYYHSKEWEDQGRIYKCFGVQGFRKLLVWIGWEKLNKAANPVKKSLDALKNLEHSTRQSEFGHLIIFFLVLALTFFVGFYYGFKQTLWLLLLNIVLNAYPIGVQRYNRPRLQKIIDRFKDLSPGPYEQQIK